MTTYDFYWLRTVYWLLKAQRSKSLEMNCYGECCGLWTIHGKRNFKSCKMKERQLSSVKLYYLLLSD